MEQDNLRSKLLIPPKRRFWMCRADGGKYVDHFKTYGMIGLGHVDKIKNIDLGKSKQSLSTDIQKHFKANDISNARATSHLHQIIHFVYDAEIGDVVVTVSSSFFHIGVIESNAYYNREKKKIFIKRGGVEKEVEMLFFLRRDVKWIASISRMALPFNLSRGITSHQSFFSLDDYEDEIYSTVAQFVYKDGKLITSYQIRKEDRISAYHYRKLTGMLLKAEFLSQNIGLVNKLKSEKELYEAFTKFCEEGKVKTSLTAQFASPGWTSFLTEMPFVQIAFFIMLVNFATRGGKIKINWTSFEMELNEQKSKTTGEKITDLGLEVARKWLLPENENVRDVLELKDPGQDVDLKQLESKSKKT